MAWLQVILRIFYRLTGPEWSKFLVLRILIVTTIFGLGGGFLQNILDAKELNGKLFTGFAIFISLTVSLLISLLLKNVKSKTINKKVKRKAILLVFIGLLLSVIFIFVYGTLKIEEQVGFPDDKTWEYSSEPETRLKGLYYSDEATAARKAFKAKNQKYPDDKELLSRFPGEDPHSKVWGPNSILLSQIIIFVLYILVVTCFVGTISFFSELLFKKEEEEVTKQNEEELKKLTAGNKEENDGSQPTYRLKEPKT